MIVKQYVESYFTYTGCKRYIGSGWFQSWHIYKERKEYMYVDTIFLINHTHANILLYIFYSQSFRPQFAEYEH